jgi:hypothetical protein
MKNLELTLIKRNNKFILYIIAGLFCTLGTILFLTNLLTEGFSWWALVIGLLFVFGQFLILSRLYIYFTSKQVNLMIESDGNTMAFYNKNNSGKIFNRSEQIDLSKMGRFYIVKQRTRYFMNNYSYAFEEKGSKTSLFKTEINAFPSLFEASMYDRDKVLEFVKNVYPEIDLGYENAWQKAAKNRV